MLQQQGVSLAPSSLPCHAPLTISIRFCGGDKRYCGDGCQSAFGNCAIPNSTTLGNPACSWSDQGTSPRCDGQCGSDNNNARCDASFGPDALADFGVFNYGPCCSSSGYDCFLLSLFCELLVGNTERRHADHKQVLRKHFRPLRDPERLPEWMYRWRPQQHFVCCCDGDSNGICVCDQCFGDADGCCKCGSRAVF